MMTPRFSAMYEEQIAKFWPMLAATENRRASRSLGLASGPPPKETKEDGDKRDYTPPEKLSPRGIEIRLMLQKKMRHHQIAQKLGVSRAAVTDYIKRHGINKW